MISLPNTLLKLVESFKRLPGVGAKTAERLAYHMIESDELYNLEWSGLDTIVVAKLDHKIIQDYKN